MILSLCSIEVKCIFYFQLAYIRICEEIQYIFHLLDVVDTDCRKGMALGMADKDPASADIFLGDYPDDYSGQDYHNHIGYYNIPYKSTPFYY